VVKCANERKKGLSAFFIIIFSTCDTFLLGRAFEVQERENECRIYRYIA